MARQNRLTVAGLPHHVIWLGHSASPVFVDDADRQAFLRILSEVSRLHDVHLHAYLLTDRRIHLLCTPQRVASLSLMMQGLGRAYVRRFNLRHARQGTLWDGRYRCTVIEPGELVLSTMVMLDTEPVHLNLSEAPAAYLWSSHAHYLGRRLDVGLVAPQVYWDLGNTPFAREAAYAGRVAQGLRAEERSRLTDAALKGWALGEQAFLVQLQGQSDRRVTKGRPGRPRKAIDF